MKIGLLYTSATPELIGLVEGAVRQELGEDAELHGFENPSIIAEVRDAGYVTPSAATKWLALYLQAVEAGCDVVLSVCSSVADVVDAARDIAAIVGVPLVRIDEDMCWEAVKCADRIAVAATHPVSMGPVRRTIQRMGQERGKTVELFDCLVKGGDDLAEAMASNEAVATRRADLIVLAQASMAEHEAAIAEACRIPVFSSPRFGAAALKAAFEGGGAH